MVEATFLEATHLLNSVAESWKQVLQSVKQRVYISTASEIDVIRIAGTHKTR